MFASHLLLAGGEVNSDPGRHGFGVSEEGVKAEGELLQVFSLDVAEGRLNITNRKSLINRFSDEVEQVKVV